MHMLLTFKEIEDDKQWDDLVKSLPSYSFLNSSARYRYNKEIGVHALRIAVYKENTFLGIITCVIGKSKLFGNFLECKHSPILIENKEEYWEEVLEYCKKIGRENSCFMLRFSPLYLENEILTNFYNTNSFKLAPTHNVDALVSQHINLLKDTEELKRDMNKTKRNLLSRLLNDPENVKVQVFNDTSQFEFFKIYMNKLFRLKGYTDKPSSQLLKELEYQVNNGMCYMLVGYYQGKPIGVWQCTVYGNNMHLYTKLLQIQNLGIRISISHTFCIGNV
jgi:hypothetical protein